METITLNNYQRTIMDNMVDYYHTDEHHLSAENVALYVESTEGEISRQTQQQLYIYLYGVHEDILYHANDNDTRMRAESMMDEFDIAVEQLEEINEYEDAETVEYDEDDYRDATTFAEELSHMDLVSEYGTSVIDSGIHVPHYEVIRQWTPENRNEDSNYNLHYLDF